MTLQKLLTCTIACLLISFAIPTKATHIMGADFEYTCLGGDTFEVTLNLYSHCNGIPMTNSQGLTFSSTCGQTFMVSAPLVYDSLGSAYNQVSTFCDSITMPCAMGVSNSIGIRHHAYTTTVVLSPPCDTWTVTWGTCCRNNTINVPTSNSDNFLINATFNTASFPCNDSPQWNSHLAYTVCSTDTACLDFSATDPEGDSLSYALADAWGSFVGSSLVYGGGYSGAQPVNAGVLDPATGVYCVSPTIAGEYIVVVEITQYDSQGNAISTTRRDIHISVANCGPLDNGETPYNMGGFTNITGNASQLDSMVLSTCVGENICFDYVINDADATDTLALLTQIDNYLPGAVVTLSGANPLTVNVCWTAQPSSMGYWNFPILVTDDHCPLTQSTVAFGTIDMQGGVFVSGNTTSCAGNPVQLTTQGSGAGYAWTSISGDPINVGVNFSCDTCATVIASPSTTTTYVVTGSGTGGCPSIDTITVIVDPGFTVAVSDSIYSMGCSDDSVKIALTPTPSGTYTYAWSGATLTSNGSNTNSIIVTSSGQHEVGYTVTSAVGCVESDTLTYTVSVSDFYLTGDTIACPNDSVGALLNNSQGIFAGDWYECGTGTLVASNTSLLSLQPAQSTCYYAVYSDMANGCTDTLYHNITFLPTAVTGTVTGPTDVEIGDTVTYYVSGGSGTSWIWGTIGGSIYSGVGTDTIQVIWNTGPSGLVWAVAEDFSTICSGLNEDLAITINEPPIGINEQAFAQEFTLAPNPAGDVVNIIREHNGRANVILTDISGKQLQSIQSHSSTVQLDVSDLASGVYFITVQHPSDGTAKTMKFLIER